MSVLLSLRGITKSFGGHRVLDGLSLEISQGQFVALLGPSGCGKTTLLRVIAGFTPPDAGAVRIDGLDITDQPPYRRPLNTVFQNYALFPHLSVLHNVAYGPRRQGASADEAHARAQETLALVGLSEFAARMPAQLSGGQQQRVALARALVNRPRLLLLDEPLSALDLKLRRQMQQELKGLQERLGIAFVFVTHDQEEAMAMADSIVVMHQGRIEQIGSGDEIYRRPASRFVADFIGEVTLLEAVVGEDGRALLAPMGLSVRSPGCRPGPHTAVLRPEHLELQPWPSPSPDAAGAVEAVVESVAAMGSHLAIVVRVGGLRLAVRRAGSPEDWLVTGALVAVSVGAAPVHLIPA